MKKINLILAFILISFGGVALGQTVFPGKTTIKKDEYFGLMLNQSIAQKQLTDYWKNYLAKFGKTKEKRGVINVSKASIPSLSMKPVEIISQVTTPNKGQSQIFIAVSVDGKFIENYSGQSYSAVESILKDFSDNASLNNEVQVADNLFTEAEKNYKKLLKDNEDAIKEMDKAEKRANELRQQIDKNKSAIESSLTDLQNKQRALEVQKSRLPK